MINKTFLLLTIFFPLIGYGQADITIGEPYGVVDAREKNYFKEGDEILTVKVDGKSIILQKFSSYNLSFKKIKVYKDILDDYTLEKVAKVQDKYYVFFSNWDKRNEKEQLFCREVDFAEGVFKGESRKLLTVNGKISGAPLGSVGYWSFGVTNKYDFYFSYDFSKMMVQYRLRPDVKNDAKSFDIIGMGVFNKYMDLQWKEEVKMPYTEKKMNNIDYSVDGEGNSYILTTVYDDNTTDIKKNKNGNANYHIELLRIKAVTAKMDITPLKIADKFINKIWLYESPKNEMICAGFYNKGKDLDDADGILLFKVQKEGKISDISTYEIPVDVINQYMSKRAQKKNEKKDNDDAAEFQELELREVIIEKDGGLLLIGEQYFVRQHTTVTGNGRTTTYYTYHYNDMLITKINANGKLAWIKKLPKQQVGRNGRGGMSYSYIPGENYHYFLFLDNEKNRDLSLNEYPARHSDGAGGFLTAYKVSNTTGNVSKEYILNTKDVKGIALYQFYTSRIVPVSSHEFVFESYKKKKEDILIKVGL